MKCSRSWEDLIARGRHFANIMHEGRGLVYCRERTNVGCTPDRWREEGDTNVVGGVVAIFQTDLQNTIYDTMYELRLTRAARWGCWTGGHRRLLGDRIEIRRGAS